MFKVLSVSKVRLQKYEKGNSETKKSCKNFFNYKYFGNFAIRI